MDALEREARQEPPHPDYAVFFTPREPFEICAALQATQVAVDRRLIDYCLAQRDDDGLDRVVTILRSSGPQQETRTRLLAHVFQHQIHHRGQVHAMLSGTRVAPPQLDEFFSAMDAPLRQQELMKLGFAESDIWQPR